MVASTENTVGDVAGPAVPVQVAVVEKKKNARRFPRKPKTGPKKAKAGKPKIVPFSRKKASEGDLDQLASLVGELNIEATHTRFEVMGLKQELMKGICSYGLERPSQIQQRAIIPCVKGRDVIVQAQSGMGKTAALAIGVLQRIDVSNPKCQAIIVAPTRELAQQLRDVFSELGKYLGVSIYACCGGSNLKECQNELMKGKQIVVGTPGRLMHMIHGEGNGPFLNISSLEMLGLDEADKLLSSTSGFSRDLTELFQKIPTQTQMILMSATMPEHILRVTDLFMRNPVKILVKNEDLTLEGIRQYFINVENQGAKLSALADIYKQLPKAQGMIFCNTRARVKEVKNKMEALGHSVSAMRGDIDQSERKQILKEFREGTGTSRMLITSDLLARGIDVQHVNLVINYDLPEITQKTEYIHRVGRGGRYGRHGIAISFVTDKQLEYIKNLEEFYETEIQEMPLVSSLVEFMANMPSPKL